MEREVKSISHAMIAHGIQVYNPHGEKNYVIGNMLSCTQCNEPWFMNFAECFLCGSFNPFLYRCDNCGAFNSITGATRKCNNCGSSGLHLECPNPNCLSNTNEALHKAINYMGGVFSLESGFKISMQNCLKCGSPYYDYQVRKVYIVSLKSAQVNKELINLLDSDLMFDQSFIIFRLQDGTNNLKYSLLSLRDFVVEKDLFNIIETSGLTDVLHQLFKR